MIKDIAKYREERRARYLDMKQMDGKQLDKVWAKHPSLRRDWTAEKGIEDSWFFCQHIINIPVLYEPLHKPLCDRLTNRSQNELTLIARGHVKSNIVTVAETLRDIATDPNVRVLIGSHTDQDAMDFLAPIAGHIFTPGTETRYNYYYPEIRPARFKSRELKWNEHRILIDRDIKYVDPTVDTASVDKPKTGRHYAKAKFDDLINSKNCNNPEQIAKAALFYQLSKSLLDPGGTVDVVGTRYAYDDLYGQIIEGEEDFGITVIPAIKDGCPFHDYLDGTQWTPEDDTRWVAFPKRFTLAPKDYNSPDKDELKAKKSLVALYHGQGSTTFANQYLLEPFDASAAIFKESDIKWVDAVPEGSLMWFRHCDLSTVKHTGDSYTAIITLAADHNMNVYITDVYWGDRDPSQIIAELLRGQTLGEDRKPIKVSFEGAMYERILQHFLKDEMNKRGVFVPIHKISNATSNKSKAERILGLQAWFESGRVHILKSCRNARVLVEELVKFKNPPVFKRMDCADALAQFPEVVFPGQAPTRAQVTGPVKYQNPAALTAQQVWDMAGVGDLEDDEPVPYRSRYAVGYS